MRYRYPRHRFPKHEMGKLNLTLHGESIVHVLNSQNELMRSLISFNALKLIEMIMTPTREDQSVPDGFTNIESLRYETFLSKDYPNSFSVRSGSGSAVASARMLNPGTAESVFGYAQDSVENQRAIRLLKDLEAHESLNADIFVTEDNDALTFRDRLQDLTKVLILSVSETLDYLDVHLKRQGTYVIAANSIINGKGAYYFERLCELLPSFQRTWVTCATATTSLPNGKQVQNYLISLYKRIIYMLESKDKIASQFYLKSNNNVTYEMLRELNYFMTLTTGTFDAMAWLFRYFYQFRDSDSEKSIRLRMAVTLKIKTDQQSKPLINHIEQRNKDLSAYLCSNYTQNLMSIFYPPRDSIQHRHPLLGIQYMTSVSQPGSHGLPQIDMGRGYSLAVLDEDTEKAIYLLDSDDVSDYFTLWGIRKLGPNTFLEPYKFVLQALMRLMELYDNVLTMLDISHSNFLTTDDLTRIKNLEREINLKRSKYVIPFLLKRTVPPISLKIPRVPISGLSFKGEAKSDESIALYGEYPMYVELLEQRP